KSKIQNSSNQIYIYTIQDSEQTLLFGDHKSDTKPPSELQHQSILLLEDPIPSAPSYAKTSTHTQKKKKKKKRYACINGRVFKKRNNPHICSKLTQIIFKVAKRMKTKISESKFLLWRARAVFFGLLERETPGQRGMCYVDFLI
ncbi:hypothetical protein Pfo_001785, partial [Paulownia fortunei]